MSIVTVEAGINKVAIWERPRPTVDFHGDWDAASKATEAYVAELAAAIANKEIPAEFAESCLQRHLEHTEGCDEGNFNVFLF